MLSHNSHNVMKKLLRILRMHALLLCYMLCCVNGNILVAGVSEEKLDNEPTTIY